jgi:hypothetical protein
MNKKTNKTKKYNNRSNSVPKWVRNYINAHPIKMGGEIASLEEIRCDEGFNDLFKKLEADIKTALNNSCMSFRYSLEPLQKPNCVAVNILDYTNDKQHLPIVVNVQPFSDFFNQYIPFCGIFIMGNMLVTAAETNDRTAELMIMLNNYIFQNYLYKGVNPNADINNKDSEGDVQKAA